MATPPTQTPTISDPMKPVLDVVDALNKCARAIDDFIGDQANPYSLACKQLRTKEQAIIDSADDLQAITMATIADEMKSVIGQLKVQIDAAQQTIKAINQTSQAIAIVAAVLAAAAGIVSGGGLAAVPAISTLAQAIGTAVAAANDQGG